MRGNILYILIILLFAQLAIPQLCPSAAGYASPSKEIVSGESLSNTALAEEAPATRGFTIKVNLPKRPVQNVSVTDVVPRGLIYVENSLVLSNNAGSPAVTISSPNDGSQPVTVKWYFGRIFDEQGQGLTISFDLVAPDIEANHEGAILGSNRVSLYWSGINGEIHSSSTSSDSIEVVEPDLNIEIQGSQIDGKAGDQITYTVQAYHSRENGADAFDADLYLIIPPGMTYTPRSMKIESGPFAMSHSISPSLIVCHFDKVDQSWNDQNRITIKYNASVDKDITTERVLYNNATLAWASATGNDARQYFKEIKSPINITDRARHVIGFQASKADLPETVGAGEILNYRVMYSNLGSFNETNISIRAEFDDNLTFISSNPDPCDPLNNNAWTSSCQGVPSLLLPGQSKAISIALRVHDSIPSGALLKSRFFIESEDQGPIPCEVYTEVKNKDLPKLGLSIEPSKKAAKIGDIINYAYNISNKGKASLYNLSLQDDKLGEIELANRSLKSGESEIAMASYQVTEADLPGPIENNAIVSAKEDVYGDEIEEASAAAEVKISNISLSKIADRDAEKVSDMVRYEFIVHNMGSTDIELINLTDGRMKNISPLPNGMIIPARGSEEFQGWFILNPGDSSEVIKDAAIVFGQDKYGNIASSELRFSAKASPISLAVTADKISAMPGEMVNYTYVVENDGQENLTLKSLSDDKVSNITLEPLNILILPGQNATFAGNCTVPSSAESPFINNAVAEAENVKGDKFRAYANFSVEIQMPEVKSSIRHLYTKGSLWINKSADKNHVYPGRYLNYSINYRNDFSTEVDKVAIIDTLPDVEFMNSSIEPSVVLGNQVGWNLGDLPPGSFGCIKLQVRVPDKPIIDYKEGSSVRGDGYSYIRKELSTERDGYPLINHVNMSGYLESERIWVDAVNSTAVTVDNIIGTNILTVEHGSGHSKSKQTVHFNTSGDRISLEKQINASYRPTSFSLPNKRKIDYESKWGDRTIAKSHIRGEEVVENYQYMDSIDKASSFYVDENQTLYSSTSTFSGGIAHMGYVKHAPNSTSTTMEIGEDYHGSFHVDQSLDSYGTNVAHARHASGAGFVSYDNRVVGSERSYEHGSGSYESDETMDQGIIYKNSTMAYVPSIQVAGNIPISYASKWGEGMSARDRQYRSRITEDIRYADYIQKESLMGTSFLSTTGVFQGYATLKAVVPENLKANKTVLVDEVLAGSYRLDTSISVYSAPVYLYPHMNLTVMALKQSGDTVLYRINVTNDGNKTLTPIEVVDMLPRGSLFINATLRPDSVEDGRVSWTLITLPIGKNATIDLMVRLKDTASAAINKVQAYGHYDSRIVKEEAASVIVLDWLPCNLNKLQPGEYPVKKEPISARFESGDWQPAQCMGVTINNSGCFEDRKLQIYEIYGQSPDDITKPLP